MATILAQRQIRMAAVEALQSANLGATISSPGDWNTAIDDLPAILIRAAGDRKQSGAKSAPTFNTTVTLELEAKVRGTTAEEAQDAIELLGDSIEQALFTNYVLLNLISQVASVVTSTAVSSEGREHYGAIKMLIDFELFEAYEAAPSPELVEVRIHVDTVAPYDQTGTYSNPPFPNAVNPAPRTSGPDGRDEGGLHISLPQ